MLRKFSMLVLLALLLISFMSGGLHAKGIGRERIIGTLHSIDVLDKQITIQTKKGQLSTFPVSPEAALMRNGRAATLDDFVVGDRVNGSKNKSGSIVKLQAKGVKTATVRGPVKAVDPKSGSVTIGSTSLVLDPRTKLVRNGKVAPMAALTLKDAAVAHTNGNTVRDVEVKGPDVTVVNGTITQVDVHQGAVTVAPDDGIDPVTVVLNHYTVITLDGEPIALSDLPEGTWAAVAYCPSSMNAYRIDALQPETLQHVEGTLSEVDVDGGTVTIESDSHHSVTLYVIGSTQILRDDESAYLSDLQPGDSIEADYDVHGMVAVKLSASSAGSEEAEIEGTITALNPHNRSLTVKASSGEHETLAVTNATEIERNDQPASYEALVVGDKASVRYQAESHVAVRVEAREGVPEGTKIQGMIVSINLAACSITIEDADGNQAILTVCRAKITRNHEPATANDLQLGDRACAGYNSNTLEASYVNAWSCDPHWVSGEISAVHVEPGSLTIQADHGGQSFLKVNEETQITLNGAPSALGELQVGDHASAEFNPCTGIAILIDAQGP